MTMHRQQLRRIHLRHRALESLGIALLPDRMAEQLSDGWLGMAHISGGLLQTPVQALHTWGLQQVEIPIRDHLGRRIPSLRRLDVSETERGAGAQQQNQSAEGG